MLIKVFPNGKGGGAAPVRYLVAPEVLAYNSNRDLIRDAEGRPCRVTRDPLPEVLRGDPARTEALIDASRHAWTYRASVISFAAEDAPSEAQQADAYDNALAECVILSGAYAAPRSPSNLQNRGHQPDRPLEIHA